MNSKWPSVSLGELLIERKESPSSNDLISGRIKIISKISFDRGQIEIRSDGETKTNMILVRPGDLVISGINATKGAIAIYDKANDEDLAATIHYGAYIPNTERVNVHYLWWLLRSRFFRDLLAENLPGGIKTELKASRLLPVLIPLPSLEEQNKLVLKLEQVFSNIHMVQELNKETNITSRALFQSILKRITEGIDTRGTIADALEKPPKNGLSVRCDNSDNGTAILSLSAITGFDYRQTEFKRTSVPLPPEKDIWLKSGDLLVTRSNTLELVGHAAIYNGTPSLCAYPDLIMRLDVKKKEYLTEFIWYWLQTPLVREFIQQKAKGTSPTMKKISQGVVLSIPFPSQIELKKQIQVVESLNTLRQKIEELTRINVDVVDEFNALLPSILDRAFKGEF